MLRVSRAWEREGGRPKRVRRVHCGQREGGWGRRGRARLRVRVWRSMLGKKRSMVGIVQGNVRGIFHLLVKWQCLERILGGLIVKRSKVPMVPFHKAPCSDLDAAPVLHIYASKQCSKSLCIRHRSFIDILGSSTQHWARISG